MIIPIPQFTAPSYGDRTLNEVQRCVNWYPEKTSNGWNLISRPGLELLDSVANNSANRGAYVTSTGAVYAANGTSVYEISNSGVDTLIGTITNVAGSTVSWTDDGTYCVVVTAGSGYVINIIAQTMAPIVDANFPTGATTITYQDGYFIVSANSSGDRGRFYLSALADPMTWTPLTFATAEYSGDPITQAKSMGSSLYLFGTRSIEVWYNTGNPDFPFERINGSTMNVGVRSSSTLATFGDSMFFLGSNTEGTGAFYQISGGLKRISTPYIEAVIASYTSQGGAYSNCWHHDGHLFFETTFPADNRSWVYDASQGTWWEASSVVGGADYHRVRSIVNRSNAIPTLSFPAFAFDAIDGKVYKISSGYNTDNTIWIPKVRIFGPIESETKRVFHSQIRIELEMKFDATGATSISPTLDWTDDGGLTYSTPITLTKAVTNTTTGQRVLLTANRLGSSASRYYRLTLPDTAKFVLKECELDLREGRF